MQLLDLPAPNVIEVFDFETIKARKLARVVELMQAKGIEYVPSESDDLMTAIEADAYDEMLLRTRINSAVKAQLLAFAKDADLDHIGATRYGVLRLDGSNPYATFTFSLSTALSYDITLPEGLLLGDGKGATAILSSDIHITAGSTESSGLAELQANVESSELKTEVILTPLPYVVSATQNETFHDGASVESNERYLERIWLSRERKSTAGSELAYHYFAKSADVRVANVKVLQPSSGVVSVYLLASDGAADQVMIDRVTAALSAEEVRPLTDAVNIYSAEIVTLDITATITVFDLSYEAQLRSVIDSDLAANTMIFGRSISASKLIGILESEQVTDVALQTAGVTLQPYQVAKVGTLSLTFTEAA